LFGRGDVEGLFTLVLEKIDVNDPSVLQRLLATTYGVAMAFQAREESFGRQFQDFLIGLRDAFIGTSATHPTDDWLARFYMQGCMKFAAQFYSQALADNIDVDQILFGQPVRIASIERHDTRVEDLKMLLMHFEEDTLGRVVGTRGRYAYRGEEHPALPHVRGTIWALGWRPEGLGEIDKRLEQRDFGYNRHSSERYIDKYAWIGIYSSREMPEYHAEFWRHGRSSDLQIDPSFPDPVTPAPLQLAPWVWSTPSDDEEWVRKGVVDIPDELLFCESVGSEIGPWMAVHGFLKTEIKALGREVFGFLVALLVDAADADRLVNALKSKDYLGNRWLPDPPEAHYIFAGEIPWHPDFGRDVSGDESWRPYRELIDVGDGRPIDVEILAHSFSWESYHSALNRAGGVLVPSARFSRAVGLRGFPQKFAQISPDGRKSTLSVGAPPGFTGALLYLRADLLKQFAGNRRLIWCLWGERGVTSQFGARPEWFDEVFKDYSMVWRKIVRAEDLAPVAKVRGRGKRSKKVSP
jgi:hypothetical protein